MSKTYGKRICVWCGKEFEATHPRQKSCKDEHYIPCPDCGIPVKVVDSSYAMYLKNGPKRCKSCAVKYSSQKRKLKSDEEKQAIQAKRIATNLQKYGVEYVSQSKEIQNKVIQTNLEKYGVERPLQSTEIYNKMKDTLKTKYGVDNVSKLDSVKSKILASYTDDVKHDIQIKREYTTQQRYDVKNIMQSFEGKQRFIRGMRLKHGVEYPQQNEAIRQKTIDSYLKNLGVSHPMKDAKVVEKSKDTLFNNYGVHHPMESEDIRNRQIQTCLLNYVVEYPMQCELVKDKAKITCIQKYGSNSYTASKQSIENQIINSSKIDMYMEFRSNPQDFIFQHYSQKPTCKQIANDVGVTDTTVYDILIKNECRDLATYYCSNMEHDIISFLKALIPGVKIVHNDRTLISPYEIDIYLPEYRLGIECNPTYTHNSSFRTTWSDDILPYRYHQQKTEKCDNVGIRLIHIYGYQWSNKRNIVVSMIKNALHKNDLRISARNTEIKEVTSKESKDFLDANHLQGATSSTVRYGLYHHDKLVSLMTFSKPRRTVGYKSNYDSNTWELTRFCTALNTNVVGGASKLFKYFLSSYHPSMITSFSDRSITTGNLYKVLGFEFDSYVDPGYVWVNISDDTYHTRVSCQKSNLPRLFHQPELDIKNQTEKEIMESHGYARVYNSGLLKWIYNC